MSKLERIVPLVDLCKQIPAGEFEDSVLVWRDHSCRGYHVSERFAGETSDCRGEQKFDCVGNAGLIVMKATLPAPTLEEIATATPGGVIVNFAEQYVESCKYDSNGESMHEYWTAEEWSESRNAAAAALRLWFRVREAEK